MKKDTNPKDSVGVRKAPISTVPIAVLAQVGLAMLEGARKYGRHNYRDAGVRASVYIDALWRHVFVQWWDFGEDIDQDSMLNHIDKGIATLVVMRDSMLKGNFVDDRPIRQVECMKELNEKAGEIIDKYPDAAEPYTQI